MENQTFGRMGSRDLYGARRDSGDALRQSMQGIKTSNVIRPEEARKLVALGIKKGWIKHPRPSIVETK